MKPIREYFIDDLHRAHKMASVQIAGIGGLVIALAPDVIDAWHAMPDDMKALLPQGPSRWLSVGVLVLLVVGRLKKQFPSDDKQEADPK